MKLTVSSRDVLGKKVKNLRKAGFIPAVIYGKHLDTSLHISVEKLKIIRAYEAAGKSTPVEITGDDINQLVLFHRLQLNPVTDRLMHVEFLAVNKDEEVGADVPVVLVGISPFEKNNLGRIQLLKQTVRVTGLPLDLPHNIEIDISSIEHEGQVLRVSDLKVSDKVVLNDNPEDALLTSLAYSAAEEEEEVVTETDEEGVEEGEGDEKSEDK